MIEVEMGGPESLEDDRRVELHRGGDIGRQLDRSFPLYQDVDFANLIFSVPTQQAVAHVAADHQRAQSALLGLLPHSGQRRLPSRERRRIKPNGHALRGGARTRRHR